MNLVITLVMDTFINTNIVETTGLGSQLLMVYHNMKAMKMQHMKVKVNLRMLDL